MEQVREEKVLPSNHERYVDIPIDQGEDITKYTELTKKVRATTEPDTAGPEHQQYKHNNFTIFEVFWLKKVLNCAIRHQDWSSVRDFLCL